MQIPDFRNCSTERSVQIKVDIESLLQEKDLGIHSHSFMTLAQRLKHFVGSFVPFNKVKIDLRDVFQDEGTKRFIIGLLNPGRFGLCVFVRAADGAIQPLGEAGPGGQEFKAQTPLYPIGLVKLENQSVRPAMLSEITLCDVHVTGTLSGCRIGDVRNSSV